MEESENCHEKTGCISCKIARDEEGPKGGPVIRLRGKWTLNQYGGSEGFLGWLTLQPLKHGYRWKDFQEDTINHLGGHLKNIQTYLQEYWTSTFPEDKIERVYVACFAECFEKDKPSDSPHLHLHIMPRTKNMGELRRCDGSEYFAWNICQIFAHQKFPKQYVINGARDNENVEDLMNYLKEKLPLQVDPPR